MSASSALQKAIYTALQTDAGLTALVGDRVYDVPPASATFPYVNLGDASFYPERQDGFSRRVEAITVHCWTRDQLRRQPCKAICDAIAAALDMSNLALDDPFGLSRLELTLSRVMDDPDGITKHGVLQFEAEITS